MKGEESPFLDFVGFVLGCDINGVDQQSATGPAPLFREAGPALLKRHPWLSRFY